MTCAHRVDASDRTFIVAVSSGGGGGGGGGGFVFVVVVSAFAAYQVLTIVYAVCALLDTYNRIHR